MMAQATSTTRCVVDRVHARAVKVMKWVAPGARCQLTELALAYPEDDHEYRCQIERAEDRKTVGCLEGEQGQRHDPLRNYCFVALSDGRTFELVERRKEPDTTQVWHSGRVIGRVVTTRRDLLGGLISATAWKLYLGERVFGGVERGTAPRPNSLSIRRGGDAAALPLALAPAGPLRQLCRTIGRLATLRFLTTPAADADRIIPAEAAALLDEKELAFYFAAALLFRTVYFKLDFAGGD
jgi:hypothetical protein